MVKKRKKIPDFPRYEVIEKATEAKFVKVRCITTGEVFNSIKEASETYKLHHSNIVQCCNGQRLKCGGMEWEYVK